MVTPMPKGLRILGADPSFSNWGLAQGVYDPVTSKLTITGLDVIKPVLNKDKQTRQNSIDIERSKQLSKGFIDAIRQSDVIAAEIPHGSQSARAMASYGVCIGILGMVCNMRVPLIQVNAIETRKVITGKKEATKAQAIAWAMAKHPEAPWPMKTVQGVTSVVEGTAEHMADAIAAIYAAMETDTFKTMAMLAKKE